MRKTKNDPFCRPRKEADFTFKRSGSFDEIYFTEENYQYQKWYVGQSKKVVTRMFNHIRPKDDWVFLDVGCALGGIVEVLRKRKFESYGIDLSRWCIQNSPVKRYLRFGSATNLPCKNKSVDVITCIDTFQYLNRKEAAQAVKEFSRVTRKYVCFECITIEDKKFSSPKENPDTVRKHNSLFTKDGLIELFENSGFILKKRRFLPRKIIGAKSQEHSEYEFSFNAIFEVAESIPANSRKTI